MKMLKIYLQIKSADETTTVASIEEAVEAWWDFRRKHHIGASAMVGRCGLVVSDENVIIARVHYNGTVQKYSDNFELKVQEISTQA